MPWNVSPSSLSLFEECPRCFWLYVREHLRRPSIPVAKITEGMDRVMKEYFDAFRKKGEMPPEILGKVQGRLVGDQALLEQWRRYIAAEEGDALLRGKLDECLVDDQGRFIPLDFKTKGDIPREDAFKYYVTQLESYAWLLERNGYPAAPRAYLLYVYPKAVGEEMNVAFGAELQEVSLATARIPGLLREAAAMLSETIPRRHQQCQFCAWVEHTHPL